MKPELEQLIESVRAVKEASRQYDMDLAEKDAKISELQERVSDSAYRIREYLDRIEALEAKIREMEGELPAEYDDLEDRSPYDIGREAFAGATPNYAFEQSFPNNSRPDNECPGHHPFGQPFPTY